jgi:hypothetical protein
MEGELEMRLDDYDVSQSADISFDYGGDDEDVMANITISGETSEVSIWLDSSDAHALSDVFSDLAKDIEQRE